MSQFGSTKYSASSRSDLVAVPVAWLGILIPLAAFLLFGIDAVVLYLAY